MLTLKKETGQLLFGYYLIGILLDLVACTVALKSSVHAVYLRIILSLIAWYLLFIIIFKSRFVFFLLSQVLSLQFSADSAAQHKLCVKEHKVRAEKSSHRPLDRTLFVLNIPPYCSEVHTSIICSGWTL